MNTSNFILSYVQSCASGRLALSDCGPIWQMGIIAVLLLAAVITLAALRFRPRPMTEKA
jgi:hypothetical protein